MNNSNELKVGKQIQNQNGKTYTVLAVKDDRALLVGGWDYVVIDDLTCFINSGSWGNGRYFPFFEDKNSIDMLDRALYYLNNYTYGKYQKDYTDNEEYED